MRKWSNNNSLYKCNAIWTLLKFSVISWRQKYISVNRIQCIYLFKILCRFAFLMSITQLSSRSIFFIRIIHHLSDCTIFCSHQISSIFFISYSLNCLLSPNSVHCKSTIEEMKTFLIISLRLRNILAPKSMFIFDLNKMITSFAF